MQTRDMNTTQTITLAGRSYTFTTEAAQERNAFRTLGTLTNSRGQFAGYVNEVVATGIRTIIGGPKVSVREQRAALATLAV
jgi:hypothetical protein